MPVASVTLDNPPANSYDLAVMQKFAADVDEAIASDARVVVVRSAAEKFFSAGADVKRFLEGDVEANMEMIRTSQAAFRRMAAAEQVFIAHIAGHALGAHWDEVHSAFKYADYLVLVLVVLGGGALPVRMRIRRGRRTPPPPRPRG